MQSSGTTEGMRGLIDSSLLKSVQKIIEYRGVFGPTVLPIGEFCFVLNCLHHIQIPFSAINVVATFVHNEPTSLTAIQEAKLPETIFKALESGIEPSFEVSEELMVCVGREVCVHSHLIGYSSYPQRPRSAMLEPGRTRPARCAPFHYPSILLDFHVRGSPQGSHRKGECSVYR